MVRIAQDLRFRDGRPDDADALSRLAQDTFEETFGGLYNAEDLNRFLEETFGVAAMQSLLADEAYDVRLAEAGRRLVGYAIIGPVTLPLDAMPDAGSQLHRLYVRASEQGVGVGRILLNWAMARARERAATEMYLGVWEHNDRAIAMYDSRNFETVGSYIYRVGRHEDTDLIMKREL